MSKRAAIGNFLPEPEEDVEQMCLFRWAKASEGKWPELKLMFHIPNGGKRSKAEAKRFVNCYSDMQPLAENWLKPGR